MQIIQAKFGQPLPTESEFGQFCKLPFAHNASITEQTAAKQIHNTMEELCVLDYLLSSSLDKQIE